MGSKLYQFTPSELQKLLDESNSYSDLLRKINMNPKGKNPETLKKIIRDFQLDETKLNENRKKLYANVICKIRAKNKIPIEDIIYNNKHPDYHTYHLFQRLIKEGYKEWKCERCGLTEWQGQRIPLELHHEDGNRRNHYFDNLKVLCPNCHALTDSFCGKNIYKEKKSKKEKEPLITRIQLKKMIREKTFTETAKELGVARNTIYRWCKKYNLPSLAKKVKEYSDSQWEKI